VIHVFGGLGFTRTERFAFYVETADRCFWNPHWLAWERVPLPRPFGLPSDF
jgi:hypothetical protein